MRRKRSSGPWQRENGIIILLQNATRKPCCNGNTRRTVKLFGTTGIAGGFLYTINSRLPEKSSRDSRFHLILSNQARFVPSPLASGLASMSLSGGHQPKLPWPYGADDSRVKRRKIKPACAKTRRVGSLGSSSKSSDKAKIRTFQCGFWWGKVDSNHRSH